MEVVTHIDLLKIGSLEQLSSELRLCVERVLRLFTAAEREKLERLGVILVELSSADLEQAEKNMPILCAVRDYLRQPIDRFLRIEFDGMICTFKQSIVDFDRIQLRPVKN